MRSRILSKARQVSVQLGHRQPKQIQGGTTSIASKVKGQMLIAMFLLVQSQDLVVGDAGVAIKNALVRLFARYK